MKVILNCIGGERLGIPDAIRPKMYIAESIDGQYYERFLAKSRNDAKSIIENKMGNVVFNDPAYRVGDTIQLRSKPEITGSVMTVESDGTQWYYSVLHKHGGRSTWSEDALRLFKHASDLTLIDNSAMIKSENLG